MTLIEKDSIDYAIDCLVERGIFKDDIGAFSTEFERETFLGAGK